VQIISIENYGQRGIASPKEITAGFLANYDQSTNPANSTTVDYGTSYVSGTSNFYYAQVPAGLFQVLRGGNIVYAGPFAVGQYGNAARWFQIGPGQNASAAEDGDFELNDLIIGPGHPNYSITISQNLSSL